MKRALVGLLLASAACAETPSQTPVRSLQSSGPVSFVCLGDPADGDEMGRTDCTRLKTPSTDDYSLPHLYALVTQPNTGEVAVVDLTTEEGSVLDADPSVPGHNFLPVGARPTDIVSTAGSMATFVAAAEPRFEGIYALPSAMIRGERVELSSWPACRLKWTPERVLLVVDPADDAGAVRSSCDGVHGEPDPAPHPFGDLSLDAQRAGTPGRYKLLVTLPAQGGIAVLDAQAILDQPAGAFGDCAIERWLPLEVLLPPPPASQEPPSDLACVEEPARDGPFAAGYLPEPAAMVHDGRRLYVSDRGAPVIHRLDMPSPCEPVEIPPLFVTSAEDPDRKDLQTSELALSPLTLDLKRYLYAIDKPDGSIIVYDVSDGSSNQRPLDRQHPETNPFHPVDRIRFRSPPRAISILTYQNDSADTQTGATRPERCDPATNGPGSIYRTQLPGYDKGASPSKLRGTFAFVVLTSGNLVVFDIDDWDAPCRGPNDDHPYRGCTSDPPLQDLARSNEYSCNTVDPHLPRSSVFLTMAENATVGAIRNVPGVSKLPLLYDDDGTLIKLDSEEGPLAPRMRATLPVFPIVENQEERNLNSENGLLLTGSGATDETQHTLVMQLYDPRAHLLNQDWRVTFEGQIPGFDKRFAQLSQNGDTFELSDPGSLFCTRGVLSKTALLEEMFVEGNGSLGEANALADYVQIISDSPVENDPYWANHLECPSFQACQQAYGSSASPSTKRDLRIVEATQDALTLEPRSSLAGLPPLTCCFPGVVSFRVRGGNQWMVTGSSVGFLHNVTIGERGVCRKSCDPAKSLLNGRAREVPKDTVLQDTDDRAFKNPFFRFAINSGEDPSQRDMQFRFTTINAFKPLQIDLGGGQADLLPTAIRFSEASGELIVSDGGIEGIVKVDLNSLTLTGKHN